MPRTPFLLVMLLCAIPVAAAAQQRPLLTEDPETIGSGRLLVEAGFDWSAEAEFPVSGLQGDLLRIPLAGVSIGISSIAEIQLDGGFYNRLAISDRRDDAPLASMVDVTGDTTSSIEDFVLGTKVRLVPEGMSMPALGLRFATKLPTASNEGGLGLDTTDFFASLLLGKTVQSVRIVGNVGLGILGDPTRGDRQNDVLTYGVSFARAVTTAAEVIGEVNGRANVRSGEAPPGTESRSTVRFGGRYTIGTLRADAAILFGVTSTDPQFGFAMGLTYVFNAFQVP